MPFVDITKAQLTSDYSNITDNSALISSISTSGDAELVVSKETVSYLVTNLSQPGAKPVLLSNASNYYKLGDYADGKVNAELVRIVESSASDGK